MPHLTAHSFAKLFTKAKLPSWTETCCCFPMKGLQSTGDQILPLLNGYKRNSDTCVTFLSFTTSRESAKHLSPVKTFDLPALRTATAFSFSAQNNPHLQIKDGLLEKKKWRHSRNHHLMGENNRYGPGSGQTPPALCKCHRFHHQQLLSTWKQ